MPGPRPVPIELSEESRKGLRELIRRHSASQQMVKRARIILQADAGKNHSQIAKALGISVDMARLWRNRWHSFGSLPLEELSVEERLEDAPRPGKPARITAEQVCRVVSLACEAPEKSGRPILDWLGHMLWKGGLDPQPTIRTLLDHGLMFCHLNLHRGDIVNLAAYALAYRHT